MGIGEYGYDSKRDIDYRNAHDLRQKQKDESKKHYEKMRAKEKFDNNRRKNLDSKMYGWTGLD